MILVLNIKDSVKQINKVADKDLKFLVQWLNANKISLHVAKTEVVIFRRKKKQLDCDLNLKLCRKKLKPSNYVRYLGIYHSLTPHLQMGGYGVFKILDNGSVEKNIILIGAGGGVDLKMRG